MTADPNDTAIDLTVIVPAYQCPEQLQDCLPALKAQADDRVEIIVVDDASPDEATARTARAFGVNVLRLPQNAGPAAARNFAARQARGRILLFVDADVVVAPDVLQRVRTAFADDPELSALFGSYDTNPRARSLISQYRNLLHHIMHQSANEEACTFWSGLGAIRRDVFLDAGGFDTRKFPRPSIEDIDLGYRITSRGHRIRLDKKLQATHLKHWRLMPMIRTDVMDRAYPWALLIFRTGKMANDLNVSLGQRLSVLLTFLMLATIALGLFDPIWFVGGAMILLAVTALNFPIFARLRALRGTLFSLACIPLYLIYLICSGVGAGLAIARMAWESMTGAKRTSGIVAG